MTAQLRHYPIARVVEVHDGDTLKLDVDLGFSTHTYVWVRLKGVRAPELDSAIGPQARQELLSWLRAGAPDGLVMVDTFQTAGSVKEIREQRTFIRYVGVVTAPDGQVLNAWLAGRGYTDQGD